MITSFHSHLFQPTDILYNDFDCNINVKGVHRDCVFYFLSFAVDIARGLTLWTNFKHKACHS